MSSSSSRDIRVVIFASAAKKEFDELSEAVRDAINVATTALQNGFPLPRDQIKALKGKLEGITEVRITDDKNAFRAYDLMSFPEVIYVLQAGMKKSHEGGEIPIEQVRTLMARKKAAKEHYDDNAVEIKRDFEIRKAARTPPSRALKPKGA